MLFIYLKFCVKLRPYEQIETEGVLFSCILDFKQLEIYQLKEEHNAELISSRTTQQQQRNNKQITTYNLK